VSLLPARVLARRDLEYNLGRITTYALLGTVVGGTGAVALSAADWLPVQRALYVVANLCLLALAVAIVSKRGGLARLQRAGSALFARVVPAVRPLMAHKSGLARYALGLIWGLVPCALTYSVLPVALFAGGALEGAAVMLAFGLGTLPNLLAAGWIVARLRSWLDSQVVRCAAAVLLAGFAAVGIWRAVNGPMALAQGPFCF
jgi:sulfite exporter TauE/SafE